MSHRGDHWGGHWITLARAINLPMDKPDKELRRVLRTAIAAMVKAGILKKDSQLEGDVVTLVRVARSLPHHAP